MTSGWAGPAWGEPSSASAAPVPLRSSAAARNATYRADGGTSEDLVVLAASVSGTSHRLAGRRCEDAYGWCVLGAGRIMVAVADGVSAAGRGGEGADLAVGAACRHFQRFAGQAFDWDVESVAALASITEELNRAGEGEAADLSTTIVMALARAETGGLGVELCRIGDSGAFGLAPDREWCDLFGDGRETGLRSTATEALPMRPGEGSGAQRAAVHLEAGAVLVLMTDGVAGPLADGPKTVAPNLAEVVAGAGSGEVTPLALAQAVDFSRRGAHDDRTLLLVAARRPA